MIKIFFDQTHTVVIANNEELTFLNADDHNSHERLTQFLNSTPGKRGGPGYIYVPDTQENRQAIVDCRGL